LQEEKSVALPSAPRDGVASAPEFTAKTTDRTGIGLSLASRNGFVAISKLVLSTEQRLRSTEEATVRTRWEGIKDLVDSGQRSEAQAQALALLTSLASHDGILACLPLIQLTQAHSQDAVHGTVAICLLASKQREPDVLANTYSAVMRYSYRCEHLRETEAIYKEYKQRFPKRETPPGILLTIALCRIRQGDDQGACPWLATLVEKYPKASEAPRALLLMAWSKLTREKYPESKTLLEQLLRDYPDDVCAPKAKLLLEQFSKVHE
jgi:tetratricopeptide (TPR) repeat protein